LKTPVRLLQAAVLISTATFCVLLFQVKSDFSYASSFYVRIVGVPFLVLLTIGVFWLSSWSSTKAIIYGSLMLLLILELIPMGLFVGRNAYPTSYYIDPQGKVVLSTFPGNVFEGKAMGKVNDDVIAAYDWQQGKTKDSSGRPLRFFRTRPDGTILVFEFPVENGEILRPLDNQTLERYESQQLNRAESFSRDGDLAKAKDILSAILSYDPYADEAYRLNQRIKQQEEDAKAEAEKVAKAEADRLEAERLEKEAAAKTEATLSENQVKNNAATEVVKSTVSRNHPQRYRTARNYAVDYDYSPPTSYYSASPSRQTSASYQQAPVQVYRPTNPQPPPTVQPQQTYVYSYPSPGFVSNQVQPNSVNQSRVRSERKKGNSWKKKLLIGGAIISGIAIEEVIRHNRR